MSGAALTVYTAGTTTPAAIYRDAALATPMSNPTSGADKADSSGRFPQVFAASNLLFDILLKDAGGVTLASYLNVPSLGAAVSTVSLDFTTSRLAFRGSGGVSLIEGGDATGDDVGGQLTLQGWLATQADVITLNGAKVNVVGRLKENDYKIPGVVRQDDVVFTAVSSVAIPLTNEPTGVRMFEVDIPDLTLSVSSVSATNLTITFSFDSGATYIAADYEWAINGSWLTTAVLLGSASDTSGKIASAIDHPGNTANLLRMTIATQPSGATAGTVAQGRYSGNVHSNGRYTGNFTVNTPATAAGRATHVKLTCSSGTMTGIARVVPQRGFGDA